MCVCAKCSDAAQPWRHGPICSRPGLVVRNSSKCGPQGLCTPPTLSLHLLPLCLFVVRVGGESGATAQPQKGGGGALMKNISMKWPGGRDACWS